MIQNSKISAALNFICRWIVFKLQYMHSQFTEDLKVEH